MELVGIVFADSQQVTDKTDINSLLKCLAEENDKQYSTT